MPETPTTDYTPGDAPVPVGAIVRYFGSMSDPRYPELEVTGHGDPADHPHAQEEGMQPIERFYPDGVAYDLWPVGVERKFGNREYAVYGVRRTSFSVVSLPGGADPS